MSRRGLVGGCLALAALVAGIESLEEDWSPPVSLPSAARSAGAGDHSKTRRSRTVPAQSSESAGQIGIDQALGQHFVTGFTGPEPTTSVLEAVQAGRVGGVILFGDNVPTPALARHNIRTLQTAARRGDQPPLLILIDQEGGEIKRLPSLPPRLSPAEIGASADVHRTALEQGRLTGEELHQLGVNVNLAPVADVPATSSSFLGTRAFGRSADIVAAGACGFAEGLEEAGVAATLKHFPGLGDATANTDFEPVVVEATEQEIDDDLAAYRECAPRVSLVMISSAVYPALAPGVPAVGVAATYERLGRVGFRGITVSDAFDTPAIAGSDRPALHGLKAGLDLILYGQNEAGARTAFELLSRDARSGVLDADRLIEGARKIIRFKRTLGKPIW